MKKIILFTLIFGMGFFFYTSAQQMSSQSFATQKTTVHPKMLQASRFSGDTLWVNDTTLVYKAQDNDWVLNQRDIVLSRNDLGKPVTSLWQFYNANQKNWMNAGLDSLAYYNKSIFKEKYSYSWDAATGLWKLDGHKSQTEDGRTLEEAGLTWSSDAQNYSYGYKGVYTYYPDKQLQSFVTQMIDTITGVWVPTGKTTYFYDQSGADSLRLVFSWDVTLNDWESTSKSVYQPEPGSNKITETNYAWNGEQQEWLSRYQKECYQHGTVPDSTVTAYWQPNHQWWLNNTKVIYRYDQAGNQTDVIYQTYYPGEKKWYNVRRFYSIYDEANKFVEYGQQLWDLTAKRWNDHERYLSEYENGQLKQFEYEMMPFDTLAFKVMYRNEYYYDNRNNLDHLLHAGRDENGDLVYISKVVCFWSPFTTPNAIEETNNNLLSIYPNPTRNVVWVNSPLSSDSKATIEIFDLMGKKLITKTTKAGLNSIDVSTLQRGTYILRISDTKYQISKQVVVQ